MVGQFCVVHLHSSIYQPTKIACSDACKLDAVFMKQFVGNSFFPHLIQFSDRYIAGFDKSALTGDRSDSLAVTGSDSIHFSCSLLHLELVIAGLT